MLICCNYLGILCSRRLLPNFLLLSCRYFGTASSAIVRNALSEVLQASSQSKVKAGMQADIMCLRTCSHVRWFVPAYTKEEVRELLNNSLNSKPPDSESAELALPRSFSNNV